MHIRTTFFSLLQRLAKRLEWKLTADSRVEKACQRFRSRFAISIPIFLLTAVLADQALSKPWYEFTNNPEVDQAVETTFKPESENRQALAEKIYNLSLMAKEYMDSDNIKIAELTDAGIPTIDWHLQMEDNKYFFLSLLIKSSDFGHNQAREDLRKILIGGFYDVDIDLEYARELKVEISKDDYLEPKALKYFYGSDADKIFVGKFIDILEQESSKKNLDVAAELLYKNAMWKLVHLQKLNKNRLKYIDSYVFLLKKAAEFGHLGAKKMLAKILYRGSFGVKRDIELAANLSSEEERLYVLAMVPKWRGKKAEIFNNWKKIEHVYYDPVNNRLEIIDDRGTHHFNEDDSMYLYKAIKFYQQKQYEQNVVRHDSVDPSLDMERVD